jgi:hypothetical protein
MTIPLEAARKAGRRGQRGAGGARERTRTDALNPFVPGVSSPWLGNDIRDYTAHIGVTLGYRF